MPFPKERIRHNHDQDQFLAILLKDDLIEEGFLKQLFIYAESVSRGGLLYRNNLKNWKFGQEGLKNFCPERATIAERQGASENENS
ncbi:hypothetical protein ELAC_0039 [Estrella lausannensis]|uniref:Uncharacterized protein n=1 Tax=Estrella lausannensis TaxID=483423 RepID=A0A0H5DNN4_9BACT|nr:hypothetical protein ELAC_0039 [Estrella lausannensis]